MKIVVFGAGGVGGYYGGALAHAGRNVHFIARGDHLKALQTRGLRVETDLGLGTFHVGNLKATDDSHQIGIADLVLVCLKTFQLEPAIPQIQPLVGPQTLILPLENGVNSSEVLATKFPKDQVLRGLSYIISYITSPGVIRQLGQVSRLPIGEWDESQTERLQRVCQELTVPGIDVELPPDIRTVQWKKFLYIASVAPVGCLAGVPIGVYRADPKFRKMVEGAMYEIAELARGFGVILTSDFVEKSLQLMDSVPADSTTSMQRDYQSGKITEVEAFSGFVSRECRKKNIPSPINDYFYKVLG